MRIVLLGATGYIGRAVALELAAAGHTVLCPCRDPPAAPRAEGVVALHGDLHDTNRLAGFFEGAAAVIHCAASWRGDMERLDATLVSRLLGFSGRVVYTGGIWLFGPAATPIRAGTPFAPPPAFRWMVDGWRRLADGHADSVLLHPALAWDETDGGELAPVLHGAGALPGPGTQRWPLVHRDDLARAYRLALECAAPGQALVAAADEGVPLRDLAPARSFAPEDPANPRCWDLRASDSALRALGWRPRHFAPRPARAEPVP